jgi:hypothetical protein
LVVLDIKQAFWNLRQGSTQRHFLGRKSVCSAVGIVTKIASFPYFIFTTKDEIGTLAHFGIVQ